MDKLQGVSKSTENDNVNEFIVHVKGEHDYRFSCETVELRNEAVTALKDSFYYKTKKNLPIFGIPTSKYKMEAFVQTEKDV